MEAKYECKSCGWQGPSEEIGYVTVREDWGDVACLKCPGCGRVEYEGMELLVEVRR